MRTVKVVILGALVLASLGAQALGDPGRCISRQHHPAGVSLSREPASIPGLKPLVSLPQQGRLKLHAASTDCCSTWPSPVGELTAIAGPYDPESHRLYLWAFDRTGWIEVLAIADTWSFGEKGVIQPELHVPADDLDDVARIERSEILGVQFYIGSAAPFGSAGGPSYRVYQIAGSQMFRVPELEAARLEYVGDDLQAGLAAFAPTGSAWIADPDLLVWYDGTGIATPPADLPPVAGLCR